MTDCPTRILSQTVVLGDDPDEIRFEVHNGHIILMIGPLALAIPQGHQDAADKLATATAEAAAHNRANGLPKVA